MKKDISSLHVPHNKNTAACTPVRLQTPAEVLLPMNMHSGQDAEPIVQVGDTVAVGQKLGEAGGFISAPVHSSVSGTVVAIEERPHASRGKCLSIVVENDGLDTLHESVRPCGKSL